MLPQPSPFVRVKDGPEQPAIFIAHGLSGTVQMQKLAKHVQTSHPIYGIRAKGIDGKEEPLDTVEEMAAFYLHALNAQNFPGPYLLVGYSFGGLVALEMAQRLQQQGREVGLLVLVDTYPHPHFMQAPIRMRLFAKRMKGHAQNMQQMSFLRALSYFKKGIERKVRRALHLPAAPDEDVFPVNARLTTRAAALRRVNQQLYLAYTRYQPGFYRGDIKFVKTARRLFFPASAASVWKRLCNGLEVIEIPGDHLSIVTSEYEGLAAALTHYIEQATAALPAMADSTPGRDL
jgi:acetoacetyl-CoA synthetase